MRPEEPGAEAIRGKLESASLRGLERLAAGLPADEGELFGLVGFMAARRDCADFRAASLLRAYLDFGRLLSPRARRGIEEAFAGFRYSMEDPGADSMCFWSENHQILFGAAEYLSGKAWPDRVFSASGLTGRDQAERARARIMRWLHLRWRFGFSEWHSNTYYEEDAAALSLLVDHGDEVLSLKSAIVLDLLLLDAACHSLDGLFAAASGRCYEAQKKDPFKADTLELCDWAFGFSNAPERDWGRLSSVFRLSRRYAAPPVLREIARARAEGEGPDVVRSSQGLDLREAARLEGLDAAAAGLFLWGMEAFTNPESIGLTMRLWKAWGLSSNAFLSELRILDLPAPLRPLLPLAVRILNPVTQGIAIQRGNSYTARGRGWMLSTAARHRPGEFADQQHIWQATFSNGAVAFATHPAAPAFSDAARSASPGPWVGAGILPDAVQEGPVHLSIHDLSPRKGYLEPGRRLRTHAWLSRERFDEVLDRGRAVFARAGEAYLALLAGSELREGAEGPNELVQEGALGYWICELGEAGAWSGRGGFPGFVREIESRRVIFRKKRLVYYGEKTLDLAYMGDFLVDGQRRDSGYPRLDSPWGRVEREPERMEIRCAGRGLALEFEKPRREWW